MTLTISPELEEQVRSRARAEGMTMAAYVEQLIREDDSWLEQVQVEEPLDESDPDFPEISAAIHEGLEQAEAGLATPAEKYFTELRARHSLSR